MKMISSGKRMITAMMNSYTYGISQQDKGENDEKKTETVHCDLRACAVAFSRIQFFSRLSILFDICVPSNSNDI